MREPARLWPHARQELNCGHRLLSLLLLTAEPILLEITGGAGGLAARERAGRLFSENTRDAACGCSPVQSCWRCAELQCPRMQRMSTTPAALSSATRRRRPQVLPLVATWQTCRGTELLLWPQAQMSGASLNRVWGSLRCCLPAPAPQVRPPCGSLQRCLCAKAGWPAWMHIHTPLNHGYFNAKQSICSPMWRGLAPPNDGDGGTADVPGHIQFCCPPNAWHAWITCVNAELQNVGQWTVSSGCTLRGWITPPARHLASSGHLKMPPHGLAPRTLELDQTCAAMTLLQVARSGRRGLAGLSKTLVSLAWLRGPRRLPAPPTLSIACAQCAGIELPGVCQPGEAW